MRRLLVFGHRRLDIVRIMWWKTLVSNLKVGRELQGPKALCL